MSRPYGINKAALDLAERLAADVLACFDGNAIESPIERLFYISFHTFITNFSFSHGLNGFAPLGSDLQYGDISINGQVWVTDWPVDFVIRAGLGEKRFAQLAVECDGHDFHERNKEQAARDRRRDRELQAAGYTVMRFTGSELYRDPIKCVEEVVAWARQKLLEEG